MESGKRVKINLAEEFVKIKYVLFGNGVEGLVERFDKQTDRIDRIEKILWFAAILLAAGIGKDALHLLGYLK